MRWTLTLVTLLGMVGCPAADDDDSAGGDDDTTGIPADDDTAMPDDDVDDDAGDDDTGGEPVTVPAHAVVADVTWTITFDEDAQAAGFSECQYTRTFAGEQDLTQPYLCPACTIQLTGEAEMTAGYEDCYEPTFGGDVTRTEYWGFTWPEEDGGSAAFFRGSRENLTINELTTVESASLGAPLVLSWTGEYALADLGIEEDGNLFLAAEGSATVSLDEGTPLVDPYAVRTHAYSCGWPTDNPGDLQTDWLLAEDATFPTAALEDECGELVNLWDFHGRYLVVDSTLPDCGFCLTMAQQAPDFLAEMDDLGIPAEFVSLLGEGLSNVVGEPSQSAFDSYQATYGHGGPLLKDRGFGYAVFEPYWADDLGYPIWAVIRPDMSVLYVGKGFDTWDEVRDLIVADSP